MATRKISPLENPAFELAVLLLIHPASLFAMLLLGLNDHLLRRMVPGWWTGKLGDAAWLFITPYLLAALLAWLIPYGWPRPLRQRWSFGLAFFLIGASFSLGKAIPAAQSMIARLYDLLFNSPPSFLYDPTDLWVLPALAASFWLFWRVAHASQPAIQPRIAARALVALPLAALLMLADAAAPDPGITCFSQQDSVITASSGYSAYFSKDGGQTWEQQPGQPVNCQSRPAALDGWQVAPGPQNGVTYRYQADQQIQRSTDSGQTWQTILRLKPLTEAEQAYLRRASQGNPMINPAPLDALADPVSGNMLFAMGHQGVLTYTPQGQWVWSQHSGPYQHTETFPNPAAFSVVLGGQVYLAGILVLLIYATLALRWVRSPLRMVIVILSALGWLLVNWIFPPTIRDNYSAMFGTVGMLLIFVLLLALVIEMTIRLVKHNPHRVPGLLLMAILGGLLYLLPYGLWMYSTLPSFEWAMIFSLVLAAAVLVGGWLRVPRMAR